MKKWLSLFLVFSLLFGMTVPVYGNDSVKIKVDGKEVTDAQAVLKDGSTLLPVRSVSNALGCEVTWDGLTKTVLVEKDGTNVIMPVGESIIIVDDEVVNVSVPAMVIGGRTYVPLRVLGNALDCDIVWVKETKTVEITSKSKITDTTPKENKDLFAENKSDVPYFLSDGVYLTEDEVVPIPVVGGNWIWWSNTRVIDCEWSYYNGQQVILITGVGSGMSSLKIYNSSSQRGTIEGDYTEIKVNVVSPASEQYKKQKAERVASGFDILANQADLIKMEEMVKEVLGLELPTVQEITYLEKDDVLIIPIISKELLTGTFFLSVKENTGIYAKMDTYNGNPAIFIKGTENISTDVLLRYVYNGEEPTLKVFEDEYEPNLLWDRESIRTDSELDGIETTSWFFRLRVVNGNNSELKAQEKMRQEMGISYDLYLSGLA